MNNRILIFVSVLIVCHFLSNSNIRAQVRSAVGTVVSAQGGNGGGTVCLKIKQKQQCFEWSLPQTKFTGFNLPWPKGATLETAEKLNLSAWETGAEWHITYSRKKMFLNSAIFRRRVIR